MYFISDALYLNENPNCSNVSSSVGCSTSLIIGNVGSANRIVFVGFLPASNNALRTKATVLPLPYPATSAGYFALLLIN